MLKENEEVIDPLLIPLFDAVNYDPDEFLLQKIYKKIPQDHYVDYIFMLAFQFEKKPFLIDYFYDIANGHLDIFNRPEGYRWHYEAEAVQDVDIVTRLYFADSEKDIWELVNDLPSDVADNLNSLLDGNAEQIMGIPSYLARHGKANALIFRNR